MSQRGRPSETQEREEGDGSFERDGRVTAVYRYQIRPLLALGGDGK